MKSGHYLRQGVQRRNASLGLSSETDKGSYLLWKNKFENSLFFLLLLSKLYRQNVDKLTTGVQCTRGRSCREKNRLLKRQKSQLMRYKMALLAKMDCEEDSWGDMSPSSRSLVSLEPVVFMGLDMLCIFLGPWVLWLGSALLVSANGIFFLKVLFSI